MKIMHLGPFSGNAGDLFSYSSFQKNFRKYVDQNAEFYNINIRDFYFNCKKRQFNDEFLDVINGNDLFVIGGGQYFDVKWKESATGTTLNFDKDFIDGIEIPVLINSIGYTEPEEATLKDERDIYDRFKEFISYVGRKPNWLLTVRNDGSYNRMRNRFGAEVVSMLHEVPDNGLYFDEDVQPYKFDNEQKTIGIQITDYMFTADESIDLELFYSQVGDIISLYIEQGCRIILFPHVPQDLLAITKVLRLLPDNDVRNNVVVAPYNTLDISAARMIVGMYKACDLCVAMRFHANVIAIQNRVPTIALCIKGLGAHRRISGLYEWLGLDKTIIETDGINCISDKVLRKTQYIFSNMEEYEEQVDRGLVKAQKEREQYFDLIHQFVTKYV